MGDMVATEELAVIVDTTVVKTAIKKSFARTQIATQAKKKKASKAKKAKKPKAAKKPKKKKKKKKAAKKKKKKRKKKKKKKSRLGPNGKRAKGQHKSKGMVAAGKKTAAKLKKAGKGIFKPVTVSSALAKVTGISGKTTRGQVFKALWAYIKKKGLNKGRTVGKIDGIWNGGSMFKMTAAVSKHVK